MNDDDEIQSVGWDAISANLTKTYGDREPKHYGTLLPTMLGGKDPLQGISVYKNLEPLPHFHYVTYGFSDLYEKTVADSELSGFGFELTFRLACSVNDDEPPVWALNFLQNIARYVFSSGNQLEENHHMDLHGPIALGSQTEICYIALARDPQLDQISSKNGQVTFLQIVGLCASEYELLQDWKCEGLLKYIGRQWPLLITDLNRKSVLVDPVVAEEMHIAAEKEGSSQGEVFVATAEWSVNSGILQIKLGATAVKQVLRLLRTRVGYDKQFAVFGRKQGIVFQSHVQDSWKTQDDLLATISVSPQTLADIRERLKPTRGTYYWDALKNLVVEVVPSEIKDRNGKVIEVIG